ncbi:hypothetical protein ACE2AJ_20240 [Aquihabitans daechungensis]|uniref:hypothetical protein n=1 Tax=Aquihabitans daechungensis TaxID=1052257 RepID=UPI003B9FE934
MTMALGLGTLAFVAPSISAGGNPPGANGTVKVDRVEFDTAPNNQPHVGCSFQIDFYGFDQGAYNAGVDFSVQPPTGKFTSIRTDSVFIGEDAAGGGVDLDAERTYDLTDALAPYAPHPNQGYHVKLTVSAPGAGGKVATKHKVFWVQGCETPPCVEVDPYTGECYIS